MSPQAQACKQDLQAKLGAPAQAQGLGFHHKPLQQLVEKGRGLGGGVEVVALLLTSTPHPHQSQASLLLCPAHDLGEGKNQNTPTKLRLVEGFCSCPEPSHEHEDLPAAAEAGVPCPLPCCCREVFMLVTGLWARTKTPQPSFAWLRVFALAQSPVTSMKTSLQQQGRGQGTPASAAAGRSSCDL